MNGFVIIKMNKKYQVTPIYNDNNSNFVENCILIMC